MKNILFLFVSLLFVSAVSGRDTLNVLFIGNSFTFMNNMPDMVRGIAVSKDKLLHVERITEGGKSLEYHAGRAETYETIKKKKWDYVVLQELSNTPAQPESKVDKISLPYAKQLVDSIHANNECTELILYMTWGYKNGNSQWKEINTYESMQERIQSTYFRFADILNARIAPVGEVWKQVRKNYPGLDLYDPDNFHPNPLGSYLAAATFYATIFGESPYGSTYTGSSDMYSAEILQLMASQVVLNNPNMWRIIYNNSPLRGGFDVVIKGEKVNFLNRAENAVTVEWDLGNGSVSREPNPEVKYKKGKYLVRQIVTAGCEERIITREIQID
ncbi:DUF4886 domain-containing protein [Wandonia haliotis]|uniref:DUF4886 domain-containing protein n=1 Tax=Wandonia haliotis TaxID=574963 RepID=UPI0031DB08FE